VANGVAVAVEELLIGATALHLDFGVATLNIKHFALIPELTVTAL
jgi:predicted nucleic acid-binding protein